MTLSVIPLINATSFYVFAPPSFFLLLSRLNGHKGEDYTPETGTEASLPMIVRVSAEDTLILYAALLSESLLGEGALRVVSMDVGDGTSSVSVRSRERATPVGTRLELTLAPHERKLEGEQACQKLVEMVPWSFRALVYLLFKMAWANSPKSTSHSSYLSWKGFCRYVSEMVEYRSKMLHTEQWQHTPRWWGAEHVLSSLSISYLLYLGITWNFTVLKPPCYNPVTCGERLQAHIADSLDQKLAAYLPLDLGDWVWSCLVSICSQVWPFVPSSTWIFPWDQFIGPNDRIVAKVLGMDQMWGVFAPKPPGNMFWLVIPGNLRDGSEVDIERCVENHWNLGEGEHYGLTNEKPELFSSVVKSHKWFKFYEALGQGWKDDWEQEFVEGRRVGFGRWICSTWNLISMVDQPKKQLMNFTIEWHTARNEITEQHGQLRDPVELWAHSCY